MEEGRKESSQVHIGKPRTRASPRSRQPQTKGTLNLFLLMWFSSSAMVSTSDSSM